jgi:acetolactate synthase-1/3 small subunit
MVSRLTLVTFGSDEVIDQISKQLGKLVDVVSIRDMTGTDHIERELAMFKMRAPDGPGEALRAFLERCGGRILEDSGGYLTVELIGEGREIDRFLQEVRGLVEVEAVVRSGPMALSRGAPIAGAT